VAVSVLIADPQYLTREGISSLLRQEKDFQVATVNDFTALNTESNSHPNVMILDYMAGKSDTLPIKDLMNSWPSTGFLIVSSDNDMERIRKVINYGVKGYLTKNCEPEEILTAVRMIARGNRFFCNKVMELLVHVEGNDPKDCDPMNLSSREFEVLKLIAQGFSTIKIADKLNISVHTVNSHRKNILKKLNIKSPTQLVAYAHETGLVKSKKP